MCHVCHVLDLCHVNRLLAEEAFSDFWPASMSYMYIYMYIW